MRLVEEPKERHNKRLTMNGVNGNGNGIHASNGDGDTSESESDMEDAEPVSATLVLRIINEPPSPESSTNLVLKPDQSEDEGARRTSFLQVIFSKYQITCSQIIIILTRSKFKEQIPITRGAQLHLPLYLTGKTVGNIILIAETPPSVLPRHLCLGVLR